MLIQHNAQEQDSGGKRESPSTACLVAASCLAWLWQEGLVALLLYSHYRPAYSGSIQHPRSGQSDKRCPVARSASWSAGPRSFFFVISFSSLFNGYKQVVYSNKAMT